MHAMEVVLKSFSNLIFDSERRGRAETPVFLSVESRESTGYLSLSKAKQRSYSE
jgi:hypothetical protein